jgi:hypothetical protein
MACALAGDKGKRGREVTNRQKKKVIVDVSTGPSSLSPYQTRFCILVLAMVCAVLLLLISFRM